MISRRQLAQGLVQTALAVLLAASGLFAAPFRPVAARQAMVVSSEPFASEAGLEILMAGGNAVDAAVAVGFALAVTHPQAGNIGGGGFMLIRLADGESALVDYREEAPAAASRDMYLDSEGKVIPGASTEGALSVGVPGTVAGLALAHKKYGKLPWKRVLAPAIRLAARGFPVSYELSEALRADREQLAKFPESRRIFLRNGRPYEPGETFRQPELAKTLRRIVRRGPAGFYQGRVARAIVSTLRKYHGRIELADLQQYQAKIRPPLRGTFRGYEILTVPPPSSGGVGLIEMLNVLEPLDLGPPNSYESIHLIAETMRRAYADRAAYLGDADFTSVPVSGLTSKKYAAKLRDEILHAKAEVAVQAGRPAEFEAAQTTHFSVVDADGNAVANTYTLNGSFGSYVTVEGAGFLLNDEMDDFTSKPGVPNMYGLIQSEANAIAPHKRPLSAMTPSMVVWDGKVRLVLGSPGGGTIINTVLQVLLNVLVFHMDIRQAVTAPRFHHQWMPDQLVMERWGFSADTIQKLEDAGYKLEFRDRMGACEAIEINPETGWRFGAADPRAAGKAVGY
jgi:gamma-glutamyltranspeptidase/glutathione hydrolase